ncbi:MAG: CRP-like cAMP-binding protein [Oceanospirillaceae bacterium]|jgi:CRP-like cAMP-binding protein
MSANQLLPQTIAFLRQNHPISDEEIKQLQKVSFRKSYNKKEVIVQQGKTQMDLLFVRSGIQINFVETERKLAVGTFYYAPSLCFIPNSFYQQVPSPFVLQCLTGSEFNAISFTDLQQTFDKYPNVERLFRKISKRITVGLIERQVALQTQTIEERFQDFCKRSPHLLQMVPHKYIATYLNIDPTNFSKLYNSVRV